MKNQNFVKKLVLKTVKGVTGNLIIFYFIYIYSFTARHQDYIFYILEICSYLNLTVSNIHFKNKNHYRKNQ